MLGEELTSDAIWYDNNSFSTGFGLKSFSTNIWDINLSYTSNTSLANFANKSLFSDNISFSELNDRGVTLFTLRDTYEVTATKLNEGGYTSTKLQIAGYTYSEMESSTYSAVSIKYGGF